MGNGLDIELGFNASFDDTHQIGKLARRLTDLAAPENRNEAECINTELQIKLLSLLHETTPEKKKPNGNL